MSFRGGEGVRATNSDFRFIAVEFLTSGGQVVSVEQVAPDWAFEVR